MILTQYFDKQKVSCLTRDTKLKLSPIRWLDVLENVLRSPVQVIKEGAAKRTVKTALAPWGEVCLHDRRYQVKKQLLSPFRPSPGKKMWKHSLFLIKNKFPIAEPLLYLELKKGPFVKRTFLVTKWQESTNLGKPFREKHSVFNDLLVQLLQDAARLVARLHNDGFVHGDLKWSNFLWVPSRQDRIVLTDLDHIERSGSAEKQGRDLARFILSAAEFQLDEEIAESMINCYFNRRQIYPIGLEKCLERHVKRKQSKYKNRHQVLPAIQNTNDS
ncbi:MAG: lipopolysaccharide kinase InaA family protein [Desulfobacterales bacterium]